MDIGSNLSKARKIKGLSQEELANQLNVSRQCVSLWENNQTMPTLENMAAMSDVLGFSISVLTGQMPFPNDGNIIKKTDCQQIQEERNHQEAKKLTILALIFSFISCILFLVPGLGLVTSFIGALFSILAKKKESTLLNSLSLVFGIIYFFAGIVVIVGMDYVYLFF